MILSFISLSACSLWQTTSFKADSEKQAAETLPMLDPIGPASRIVQEITAHWQGKHQSFTCVLELDPKQIAMAAVSKEGLSLFNLYYDGKVANIAKSELPKDVLPPEKIIEDLQLAYWPLSLWQEKLSKSWHINDDTKQRRLYLNDELVTEIAYHDSAEGWPKTLTLTNHRYRYKLKIKTISYEALSQ